MDAVKQLPRLESGDRLDRAEFERRYAAMPGTTKAELIDGVVYVASPTKHEHSRPHGLVGTWLGAYEAETPGVETSSNGTLRLDDFSEPQPDVLLRVLPEAGGRARLDADGYLAGAAELVVEVAATSASYDLHQKKEVYRQHGIREYLVVVVHEETIQWFDFDRGDDAVLAPDPAGILRSRVFPGLWLDTAAILRGDLARLVAVLREGLGSAEHAAFTRALAERRSG